MDFEEWMVPVDQMAQMGSAVRMGFEVQIGLDFPASVNFVDRPADCTG